MGEYISTMTQLIMETRDLGALGFISTGNNEQGDISSLPSLVCGFGSQREGQPRRLSTNLGIISATGKKLYSATGLDRFIEAPKFEENGLVLNVNGLLIDTVEKLGVPAPPFLEFWTSGRERSLGSVLLNWLGIINILEQPGGDDAEDLWTSFWRTFQLDIVWFDGQLNSNIGDEGFHRLNRNRQVRTIPETLEEANQLVAWLDKFGGGQYTRRFTVTSTGRMGIAPNNSRTGDFLCILDGGEVPYVLRQLEEGYHQFIGEW